jgi:hypothetical protein
VDLKTSERDVKSLTKSFFFSGHQPTLTVFNDTWSIQPSLLYNSSLNTWEAEVDEEYLLGKASVEARVSSNGFEITGCTIAEAKVSLDIPHLKNLQPSTILV